MLLFYIRHGDPIYDPDMLTPLGKEQAEAVARRLALFGIDEIYSSTSNRAMQTAEPTCKLLGLPIQTLDFLNENKLEGIKIHNPNTKADWVWSNPKYSQLLASREIREMGDRWWSHPELLPFHFENTILPINDQLDSFIASHGYLHDTDKGLYKILERNEKRIAVFAHESMGKIFMSHLLDIPYPYYAVHFEMHTSGMTVIKFDDGEFFKEDEPWQYARARVLTLSNDSHLYRDKVCLNHRFTHLRIDY